MSDDGFKIWDYVRYRPRPMDPCIYQIVDIERTEAVDIAHIVKLGTTDIHQCGFDSLVLAEITFNEIHENNAVTDPA